jgi:hypothetical protein
MGQTPAGRMEMNETATAPAAAPQATEEERETQWKALMADFSWAYEQLNAGGLGEYAGELIVVHNRTVLGHSRNGIGLQQLVAAQFGIPISQLAVVYVDDGTDGTP